MCLVLRVLVLLIALPAAARPDLRELVFVPAPLDADRPANFQNAGMEKFLSFDNFMPLALADADPHQSFDYDEAIARTRAQVDATIDRDGPYSQALEQQLRQLAGLYQDSGRHQQALDTYQHAIQLSKITFGLYHEDQIPIVESVIKSLMAIGKYDEVDDRLEFLIYLHQKYYGANSTRLIKPLASKVAWDMHFFEHNVRFPAGEGPDLDGMDNALAGAGIQAGAPDSGPVNLLTQTQQLIIRGIQILVKAKDFSNPFLHQFEQQLIETYFYQAYRDGKGLDSQASVASLEGSFMAQDPYDLTKANFENGVEAYNRLLAYMVQSRQDDSLEYVLATIGLGDWYLLFDKLPRSREQYDRARRLLEEGNFPEQDRRFLLDPAVPTQLPAFGGASPAAADAPASPETYRGYVDVAYTINRFGHLLDFAVLDTSAQVPGYIVSELEWRLRDGMFRPGLAEDAGAAYRVRYYYSH